jgi:hypothetical protein
MKKSLIFFWVMFYLMILTKTALSYDYNWSNYTEPYNNTVDVLLNRGSSVLSLLQKHPLYIDLIFICRIPFTLRPCLTQVS